MEFVAAHGVLAHGFAPFVYVHFIQKEHGFPMREVLFDFLSEHNYSSSKS